MQGSLVNRLLENTPQPAPKVGDGVTILCYSDRRPATVVEVFEKEFIVRDDITVRLDQNGHSESQEYSYHVNPHGARTTFRRATHGRLKGQWRENGKSSGNGVIIGQREKYYDYSF